VASSDPESRADRVLRGLSEHERTRAENTLPDRYELLEEIGRGGMAVVYRARDRQLDREVAVKVMRDDVTVAGDEAARFQREVEATAKLLHPNVVTVFDAGPGYLVMELLKGGSLEVRGGPPSVRPRAVAALLANVAHGVHAAHQAGVVHRDLKPSNILLSEAGEPKVADFGVAHLAGDLTALTLSGMVVGTPRYMAPEQVDTKKKRITARTDVYALGAILYECLTGRSPHPGDDPLAVFDAIVHRDPVPPRMLAARIPVDLQTIVLKALEKDPSRRYATAADLAEDLERFVSGRPIQARPASPWYKARKGFARRRGVAISAAGGILAVAVALAVLLPMLGRSERTLALWREITTVLSDAEIDARGGEVARARERLDAGIASCRTFLERDEIADAHYFLGRLLRARGKRPEALVALDRALELRPELTEAHLERGLLRVTEYEVLERRARSVLAGQPAGSKRSTPPDVLEAMHPRLGAVRRAAIADLSAEVGASPYVREADALFGRAELERMRWNWAAAEAGYRKVLAAEPLYVAAEVALAKLAWARQDYEGALEHANLAATRHQGLGEAFLMRGRAYFERSEREGPTRLGALARENGLQDLKRALEILESKALAWVARGDIRQRMGELENAVSDYTRAIEADPSNAIAHNHRGRAHVGLNRWQEALEDFSAAIRLSPDYASAWAHRAQVRMSMGDLDGARRDAEKALEVVPSKAMNRPEIEKLADYLRRMRG